MSKINKWTFWIVLGVIALVTYIAIKGINLWELQVPGAKELRLGIDIRGGVEAVYMPKDLERMATNEELESVKAILETRLDHASILDREITIDKNNGEVLVRFPWKSGESQFDPQKAIKELGETALLTFQDPEGKVILEGKHVKESQAEYNTKTNEYVVMLKFDDEGTKLFADATEKLIGQPIAIYMDDICIQVAKVEDKITQGSAYISGMASLEEAKSIAGKIQSGALPFALESKNFSTISPTLGSGALKVMIYAGCVTFIVVGIFLVLYYRLPGFVACFGLVFQIAVQLLFLSIPQITLTLPGIAGIILSIGMGVDANIIIAERIKEEIREGKRIHHAIVTGYKRAFTAVFDGNITMVIVGVILMVFGSGAMLSFGYTLLTGVLMNFVSGVTASKLMITSLSKYESLRKPYLYGARRARV